MPLATLFMKRELPFARARVSVEWMQPPIDGGDDADEHAEFAEDFAEDLLGAPTQCELCHQFCEFGKGADTASVKSWDDVYHNYLESTCMSISVMGSTNEITNFISRMRDKR